MHHRKINPDLAERTPAGEPLTPIPSCDGSVESGCPLTVPCPICGPIEEFVGNLRVVVGAPDPCEDCVLHARLHAEAHARRELRSMRSKEVLREVESRLGVLPYELASPGYLFDEDRAF